MGMVPAQERRVTYGERYEDSVEIRSRQEYQAAMRAQGRQPAAGDVQGIIAVPIRATSSCPSERHAGNAFRAAA